MKKTAFLVSLAILVVSVPMAFAFWAQAGEPGMTERRLVYVEGENQEVIRLRIGDMVEIRPFDYPVVPKYLGASLQVQTDGDRCLEYIGQSSASLADESEG